MVDLRLSWQSHSPLAHDRKVILTTCHNLSQLVATGHNWSQLVTTPQVGQDSWGCRGPCARPKPASGADQQYPRSPKLAAHAVHAAPMVIRRLLTRAHQQGLPGGRAHRLRASVSKRSPAPTEHTQGGTQGRHPLATHRRVCASIGLAIGLLSTLCLEYLDQVQLQTVNVGASFSWKNSQAILVSEHSLLSFTALRTSSLVIV